MTNQMPEPCAACEAIRHHEIHIEILTEHASRGSQYAREPYRVTTCLDCGTTSQTRINGA